MTEKGRIVVIILAFSIVIPCLLEFTSLFAQDTTSVKSDTSTADIDEVNIGEIELIEISIEAVVDKPSVQIMPKRRIPDFGEMEYVNRSFENELKKGPQKPFITKRNATKPFQIEKTMKKRKEQKSN